MVNQITLTPFVKQECCNFVSDECLGIDLFGKRFRNQGICYIEEKKPCSFFASCVLPLAIQNGYSNVVRQYEKIDQPIKIRTCECGVVLSKGRQYCDICKVKNRRKTNRENQKKYRSRNNTIL